MEQSGTIIDLQKNNLKPPTFLQSNEFIFPFQEIVNTYSLPAYKEINPACFSIVTFPFLFGVMFGDIGHGSLLIIFSYYLFFYLNKLNKSKSKDSFLKLFIQARYILFLFGISSVFCGFIYNEFFSIPLSIFKSCYDIMKINDNNKDKNFGFDFIEVKKIENCIYPLGIDPIWSRSRNELSFLNSIKMKFSLIIGVLHMLLGILLSGINNIFQKEYIDIFVVFLPKFIFMSLLFGYLCVMIFIKWITNWEEMKVTAPSLINQFLDIFMKMGSIVIILLLLLFFLFH
jgi:V-type H+-transporting ATPase subunit a